MKRSVILALAILLLTVTAVWAQEEISPEWASTIKVGGYLDIRPSFYWYTPNDTDLEDEQHSSDIAFYEGGLNVTAQPFDAIRGVVVLDYGDQNIQKDAMLGGNADAALVLDEGYVQLGDANGLYMKVGKYYAPITTMDTFGMHYNLIQRNFLANPVALGLGFRHKFAAISAHMWNGSYDMTSSSGRADNDIIDTYAAGLNIYPLAGVEGYDVDLGAYFLNDFAETQGDLGNQLLDTTVTAYNEAVMLYGGYLIGRFRVTDLIGLGLRGEYVTTGTIDEDQYVDAAGEETALSATNAELALLFWEGVINLGGKYESLSGIDYFGTAGVDPDYEPTTYTRFGGFLRTNLMEELSTGLEFMRGSDNESNTDMELQIQTRVDF